MKQLNENEYVLTKDELLSLIASEYQLTLLESAGVDNWSGRDYIFDMLEEDGYEDFDEAAEQILIKLLEK